MTRSCKILATAFTIFSSVLSCTGEKRVEGEARSIRIEALADNIIHVIQSPSGHCSSKKSLVIAEPSGKARFKVKKSLGGGSRFTASTPKVRVELVDGKISFFNSAGRLLLRETSTIFREGHAVQMFESQGDESFYGLGQHQGDVFDYKGQIEELYQLNAQISIPFVQSSKGYGILYDNYSHCRFGHPEPASPLPELFDVSIKGVYKAADGSVLEREEQDISFSDIFSRKDLPAGFPLDGAEVNYELDLIPRTDGEYTFNLTYAGYIKVDADGAEVLPELWRPVFIPNVRRFKLNLQKDRPVHINIGWKPDGSASFCGLSAWRPLSDEEKGKQIWYSEVAPQLDWYFIAGDNSDEIISACRHLTGKAPMMPRWAMGYWQSRDRYRTQSEILSALQGFRKRGLPIDNIVMDWNHWPRDAWGSHEFEESRFPDPKAMVDSIHALNAHIMLSVWPKFYVGTEHFREFDAKGWLYRGSITDSLRDWLGYPYAFYDAYDSGARKLFWKQVEEHYLPLGIDAWWADATEPNVLANSPENYRKYLCGPTALGPSTEYFNAYAYMNVMALFEGEAASRPDRRPFILTRSAFAGLQRWSAAAWSGDIASRWEEMKAQISAGLNFSMSGIPWWTMDIGGYSPEKRYVAAVRSAEPSTDLEEWRELNARWFQFGAFVPIFRSHGQFPFREPWNIAPETHPAYASMEYYLRLRYRLMPYIYSMAGESWLHDGTPMRALVMDFPKDTVACRTGDEYMFGPALLVAPVYEHGARQRTVYFPENEGGWYCWYSGRHIDGGRHLMEPAPYERIPLYAKAGAIVPEGPDIQRSSGAGDLLVRVFRGADGEFELYEDGGEDTAYARGRYSLIRFHLDDTAGIFEIGDRAGSFEGMLSARKIKIVTVPSGNSYSVDYNGKCLKIKL